MGRMPQKYRRVKANVWLFCIEVREVRIDGCDLVFLAKSKDGDYHQEMNSVVFLEWFENQLMPVLKNPSLVVWDNVSYHNVKTEDTVCPNFSQKKKLFSKTITTFLFLLLIPKKYYMKK